MAADKIAEKYGVQFTKHKFDSVYGEFMLGKTKVLLLKPQTYMNNSGSAISAAAKFYKIPTDRIIIMFDDISLDAGKLRIRRKGSHGGHNGIKDIIELMGTDEIMRIKIGVGERTNRDYDLKDWVLGKIPAEVLPDFEKAVLKGNLHIKGHIRMNHAAAAGIKLILDKNIRSIVKEILSMRKSPKQKKEEKSNGRK